jgi:CheY-like chemotaxis protein
MEILDDPSLSDTERRRYLGHIKSSATRLSRTLERILNHNQNTDTANSQPACPPSLTDTRQNEIIHALVAEDNVINQELISFILKKHKIDFRIVSDGKEAIEILKSMHFDIVLMDIDMPVMNGYEATKQIRERLLLNVPIVALTASLGAEDIHSCLAAGMNLHLAKPYTETQLLMVIHKLVTGYR